MIDRSQPEKGHLGGLEFKQLIQGDTTAPLVILVHGRAGNFDVMWAFRRVLPDNVNVVAPQAHLPDTGGYSWWEIGGSKEQMREDAQHAAKLFVDFISSFLQQSALTPSKIILVGFSQGGALISLVVQQAMLAVDGAALLASFAIKISNATVSCPIFIAHGANDEIITLSQSEATRDHFLSCGAQVEHVVDDVGHKIGVNGMRELKSWIERVLER